ncbi:hypothetical protein [Intrasporangium oryzae]|uniref:hypothetical protein n=1 Tax=Intrasporangium oryzae TaxID=412687 RepID=UPI0004B527C9|nr:hypothetical protein [Intrasporangium oryzae]
MNTVVFILMIIAIVAATGPAHRRTARLPHAPFGSDVVDVDLERVLHDTNAGTSTRS